ncbi:MAG: antibiotic biosynthesis monooxygenase [Thermoleophilia bacterium]|jgi:quinol monooxygenase YgiN|nr:antibiotic biosynthesis monooxygenase [Thermoleophilia bacterium]
MARFGMHGKLTAKEGHREQLILVLMETADLLRDAEGCELYVVHRDLENRRDVWVTEVWAEQSFHTSSIDLPGVRQLIDRAMPMIEAGDATRLGTVGGVGLA